MKRSGLGLRVIVDVLEAAVVAYRFVKVIFLFALFRAKWVSRVLVYCPAYLVTGCIHYVLVGL